MSAKNLAAGLVLLLILALVLGICVSRFQHFEPTEKTSVGFSPTPPPKWYDEDLPDFSQYTVIDERKEAFFDFLFPRIVVANRNVLEMREYLYELESKEQLTEADKDWLQSQADRLRVPGETGSPEQFRELEKRLDIIPPSLMLAQAANESAWGTSRFSTKGNNLFGQWCFTEGCGMVPSRRSEGMGHEVANFDHAYASIRSYIANLNRHEAYAGLREVRAGQRSDNDMPDGLTLAEGLESYSERGLAYVREIQSMINFNQLTEYDSQFRTLLDSESLRDELDGLIADYERRFSDQTDE